MGRYGSKRTCWDLLASQLVSANFSEGPCHKKSGGEQLRKMSDVGFHTFTVGRVCTKHAKEQAGWGEHVAQIGFKLTM